VPNLTSFSILYFPIFINRENARYLYNSLLHKLHNLRQQLIRSNDELTASAQHRSQLQNEVCSLQKRLGSESREISCLEQEIRQELRQEISCLEHREAQTCLQWNLAMADKDEEIAVLSDQIQSLTRDRRSPV